MRSAHNFHPNHDLKYYSRAKLHPETVENIARAERGEMHAHYCYLCNTVYEDHCTVPGYELRCQECQKPFGKSYLRPTELHPHKCFGCGVTREDQCSMPAYFVQCDACCTYQALTERHNVKSVLPRETLRTISEEERAEFEEWRRVQRGKA